jgi:hypothetical protein
VKQDVDDSQVDGARERDGVDEDSPWLSGTDFEHASKGSFRDLDRCVDVLMSRDLQGSDALSLITEDDGGQGLGDPVVNISSSVNAASQRRTEGPSPVLLRCCSMCRATCATNNDLARPLAVNHTPPYTTIQHGKPETLSPQTI